MIRDHTNTVPWASREHIVPPYLLSFPSLFLHVPLLPSSLHSLCIIRTVSAPLRPIWPYIRVIRHWYIIPHPAFPIRHPSGLQLNPHRWVDIHTQKKINICEETTACQSCSGVNQDNPTHMSHHDTHTHTHTNTHTHTHTHRICLNPPVWTLWESKHILFYFFFNYILISILYNPKDTIYGSL